MKKSANTPKGKKKPTTLVSKINNDKRRKIRE